MAEKIFADGFRFTRPNPKAPMFVKGSISIKADSATAFIKRYANENGWLNITLKVSTAGVPYLELDTWKPNKEEVKVDNHNSDGSEMPPF